MSGEAAWDGMWDGPGWYVHHRVAANEISVGLFPEDEDYEPVWRQLPPEDALKLVAALLSALRLVGEASNATVLNLKEVGQRAFDETDVPGDAPVTEFIRRLSRVQNILREAFVEAS